MGDAGVGLKGAKGEPGQPIVGETGGKGDKGEPVRIIFSTINYYLQVV